MTHSRTSSKSWKKRNAGIELELPSGNVALVKRPGMPALMKAGIMPDSLTPIALEHLAKAERGGKPSQQAEDDLDREFMERILTDASEMEGLFLSFDKALVMCVVEPKVLLHVREVKGDDGKPLRDDKNRIVYQDIPEDERMSDEVPETLEDGRPNPYYCTEDELPVYTDEVDQEDKQFIFQFVVGGTSDLERFRREQAAALEGS